MSDNNVTPIRPSTRSTTNSSGSGPYDPGMELRVARLEDQFTRIETLLKGIDERTRAVELELREAKGRMSNLPTTWAMVTTVVAGQATFGGILWAIVKTMRP